jgi:8-oxo-dGTP diphosphatase
MKNKGEFTIRVYGLILNERKEILLTDEFQLNTKMTKFPGGGLEFGEGTINCLKREFEEECKGQKIINIRHFYTTDFYQKALFYANHQLISIYYLAELKPPITFNISSKPFDFEKMQNENQSFRWVNLDSFDSASLTFPIDRIVIKKLKEYISE